MATLSGISVGTAALALGLAFCCPAAAQTRYQGKADVYLKVESPIYPRVEAVDNTGYVQGATPTGVLGSHGVLRGAEGAYNTWGEGRSWANAATAGLHLYAFSHSSAFSDDPDLATRGDTNANALSNFSDYFTLNVPGYAAGTLFTVTGRVRIDAALDNSGDLLLPPGSDSRGGYASWSRWYSEVTIQREGSGPNLVALYNTEQCSNTDRSGGTGCNGNGSTGWHTFSFEMPNQSWSANLYMGAEVNTHTTVELENIGSTEGYASSDLGHTVAWGGITELRDASGALVTEFSALSAGSGFDYRNAYSAAVPEPQTWLMLALGLALFMALRQRRPG